MSGVILSDFIKHHRREYPAIIDRNSAASFYAYEEIPTLHLIFHQLTKKIEKIKTKNNRTPGSTKTEALPSVSEPVSIKA